MGTGTPRGESEAPSTSDTHPQGSSGRETEGDGDHGVVHGFRRRALEPSGKPPLRRNSSLQRLRELADWKRCGTHSEYADRALTRPLLRGWLHLVVATGGTAAMLLGAHLHPQAALFVLVTLIPYWLSAFLHFVPWWGGAGCGG